MGTKIPNGLPITGIYVKEIVDTKNVDTKKMISTILLGSIDYNET